jgi:shikimate 5-dehydrogenase
MSLPLEPILTAVYDRLTAQLSEPVRYAGAGGAAPARYVALQIPGADSRVTKTTRSHDTTLTLRCHTEHPTGQAKPLEAMQLAQAAETALDGWSPGLGPNHAALYLSDPTTTENRYGIGDGRRGLDVVLTYTLKSQDLTA